MGTCFSLLCDSRVQQERFDIEGQENWVDGETRTCRARRVRRIVAFKRGKIRHLENLNRVSNSAGYERLSDSGAQARPEEERYEIPLHCLYGRSEVGGNVGPGIRAIGC